MRNTTPRRIRVLNQNMRQPGPGGFEALRAVHQAAEPRVVARLAAPEFSVFGSSGLALGRVRLLDGDLVMARRRLTVAAGIAERRRMPHFGPALAWAAVVVAGELGGREALEVVQALAVFGRRGRRLRRATAVLTVAGGGPGRIRRGAAGCRGWVRGVFLQAGGGVAAAVDSRRG